MSAEHVVLDPEGVVTIRRALLDGLAAFAECERLSERQSGRGDMRVRHPTGSPNTVAEITEALRLLEYSDTIGYPSQEAA